jgi:uncharacterized membrane protein YgcG
VARPRILPQDQVKAEATNFISKTFGGPPSAPKGKPGGADFGVRETQRMLNVFFQGHVIEEDGKMGPRTKDAIVQFQQAQKLPATGIVDSKTHDFLVQVATPLTRTAFFSQLHVGIDQDDWKAETASLGKAAQDIISHAISEGDPHTLRSLSKTLSAAGFSRAARASQGGGSGGASGGSSGAGGGSGHGVTALPPPTGHGDIGPGF